MMRVKLGQHGMYERRLYGRIQVGFFKLFMDGHIAFTVSDFWVFAVRTFMRNVSVDFAHIR